ncbi:MULTISPECIES: helix-turn-helix domain-containing protein [Paenibacillus]|uniref:helix-turn-helix domain-containing protein n=1 Tax=Paenibacillus TaxID=44249 RepID=UPI0030DB1EA9
MSFTMEQRLPEPWLCLLEHLQEVDHGQDELGFCMKYDVLNAHQLFVITAGEGEAVCPDRSWKLKKGVILLVPEGITIMMESSRKPRQKLQYFKLDLARSGQARKSEAFVPSPGSRSGVDAVTELYYSPWSSCIRALEQMLGRQQTSDSWMARWEQQLAFQNWFSMLIKYNESSHEQPDSRRRIQTSVRYIHEHFDQPMTVDELAGSIQLNRASYTRQFKEATGQLPLDYVNEIRLERSKQLLQMTDDRLHDIAQNVGFSNEYYFSRRFKQYTGVSPGVYRRHQRQDVRVFAPFLEDFVLALGITPVMQYSHQIWGKQGYLELHHVPEFDVTSQDAKLDEHELPDFIMLDDGHVRWNLERLERLAPTYYLKHQGEDWRGILKSTADVLGKGNRIQEVIGTYEEKAYEAKTRLQRKIKSQTVAFLRISATTIALYGANNGYVGPIMFQDLGLKPDSCVSQWAGQQRRINIELEQLPGLNADHLFVTFDGEKSTFPGEERGIMDSREWSQLKAVRNGCIYEVDFLTWMNYGILSHGKKIDDILRYLG